LPAGTPVVRGRTTKVQNTGGDSNVYEALCPTLVFETAFHDNLNDLTLIMATYFQRNVALGIFRGIRDYYFPRLRGRLLDDSKKPQPQPNMVVYVTTTNAAPASIDNIYHSSVTIGNGIFDINLDINKDFWLWVKVGKDYQALKPQQKVKLTQNDPFINQTEVTVPEPKKFTIIKEKE
jgi:hypothetical protein